MKKKIKSTLALMLALTMVIGSSMTVFAADDGCYRPENPNNDYVGGTTIGGDDSGSSGGGSNSGSGSGSGSSGESSGGGSSYSSDSGSYDAGSGSSEGSGATYSAPAPKVAGTEASAGKESFKALVKPAAGTYKITHKGSITYEFRLMDADKKSVPCTKIALKKRDDKKWEIDFEVANSKDLTIGAPIDRIYIYDVLGISCVSINDSIIIDVEAEAAAKAAK